MFQKTTLILLLLAGFSVKAQITINNTLYTPNQLINGVLIPTGSGVSVSNVTFSGVYNQLSSGNYRYQVGHFSTATTTLAQMGFSSGIVLSTGNTSDIPLTLGANPQAAAQMSTGYTSCTAGEIRESGTCPTIINDVNVLAGTVNYYNAAILEFDFVPVGNVVQFRYIFGSEEYTDNSGFINYQCSSYNDKFGFLISGPGIAGGQGFTNNARNIARLANGSQVSINGVNNGTVGSSGGAPSAANCLAANPSWVQNNSTAEYLGTIDGTELNGNTVILTAEQTGLTPGQTYHIKLIITDVYDAAYDAVVYLEAGSFTTVACTNPPAPTTGSITQPSCTNPTGTVALSGLPSSGTWTITASPGGITQTGSGTTYNFSGLLPSTTYTFAVTNDQGCTSIASSNVAVSAVPSNPSAPLTGSVTQPSCLSPTGSVSLSGLPASGTWTITASPGSLTQTGSGTNYTFTGLNPGTTYNFTLTNALGCTSGNSSNVTINTYSPSAPVTGNITQPTCAVSNGSVELSGLPAGSWTVTASPGGATQSGLGANYTFTGLTQGSYTFTVLDNFGCLSAPSNAVTINTQPETPSAPLIGTVTHPTCATAAGSIALSGLPTSGGWTINISPSGSVNGSGSTYTLSGLTASTSYSFTVTNSVGCTSSSTLNTNINSVPAAPSAPVTGTITQPSCLSPTGSVDLSNLPAGNWTITAAPGGSTQSGSGSTYTFTGLSSGTTYTFTVTDNSTLCTSSPSFNATINTYSPTPPLTGAITQPTCNTSTGSVALSGLPIGNWTVTASPGGETLSNAGTTAIFPGLSAGITYTFAVTDLGSGCISSQSNPVSISVQPLTDEAPVIGIVTQPSCVVNTGSIELTGLPSGNWTITTSPGGTTAGSGSSYTFTGLTPFTTYSFTVTNDQSCTSSSSQATLNDIPSAPSAPVTGVITQPNCTVLEGSVELSNLPTTGSWIVTVLPAGTVLLGSGSTAIFGELGANGSYTFTVTDDNGCTSSSSTSVSINGIPTSPAAPAASVTVQPTCTTPTGTIEITAPLGVGYSYSIDGATPQTSQVFSDLTPGTYQLIVIETASTCESSPTTLVVNAVPTAPSAPVVNITVQPTCTTPTGSFEITSPLGSNYSYSCAGLSQTNPIFTGLTAGQTYSVTVTDLNTGCQSDEYEVTFNGIPSAQQVDAGPDYTITAGESVTLTATGNGTVLWDTGDASTTTVSPLQTTTYTVTLTDANGCTDTDQATVFILTDCGELFIPSAFSPNGDAVNNTFKVRIEPSCVESFQVKIYDRWGEVVFTSTDVSTGWNGTFKDKLLDPAVFVYVVDIKLFSDQEEQHLEGNLTLFK